MPRREDISSILLIGSGPIVIGQACEFDYSGTQACRVLREEGYRVVLANSNPATIMTDPEFADATYLEPLTLEVLTEIIKKEKPDALLATLGGQTALNLAMEAVEAGVLDEYGVELIGADAKAIETAEDRDKFKQAMLEIGLSVPDSGVAHDMAQAREVLERIGLPVIIRPAYILGGRGTGMAHTAEEFEEVAQYGLEASPISEILIEESIAGWKEYELEVMRDRRDNCVVVCSIENLDPMGVHTGDSITVAPSQTLTDVEYQKMRDDAFSVMRRVGVETGGSNVQFALNPQDGRQVVIEMNPRVSRSSALASKATGFPIAKIAAKLAVGYTLDEIDNDITRKTPACFEPSIDYVVTKIPRWAFEKFPGTKPVLGTQMQSVGEVMSIGRSFAESLQKALRSLELGRFGFGACVTESEFDEISSEVLLDRIEKPSPDRLFQIESLLRRGHSGTEIHERTKIDPWFIDQFQMLVEARVAINDCFDSVDEIDKSAWRKIKRLGFSDKQIAYLFNTQRPQVAEARKAAGVWPSYKTVDSCAAEFEATTPYHYSTWEDSTEVAASAKPKVIILGSGPNRIGQGIEFDYCCVHASFALSEAGYETVMVNCNPETVSTDYDTSDRLYFEPLTVEDVTNIIEAENLSGQMQGGAGVVGVIVSLGGQTPLKLASGLDEELIAGTKPASIDVAEDRDLWNKLCEEHNIAQPAGATALSRQEALAIADEVGYPVLIRPSYVLGGRAMTIVYDQEGLVEAMRELEQQGSLGREGGLSSKRPVLIDRFLEGAIELDVDAIRDMTGEVIIGGIMEHVEQAGVHSGDSACMIPPKSLGPRVLSEIEATTRKLAKALDVVGLLNVQFAVTNPENDAIEGEAARKPSAKVWVIEANPRASRTVPFVAKATGRPLVKIATRVMMGTSLQELREEGLLKPLGELGHVAVKEAVLPFSRFPETDQLIGPEMRSTGEVMGIDRSLGLAFAKSQLAAGALLPSSGTIFVSVSDQDKPAGIECIKDFQRLGFKIVATSGTAAALREAGVSVESVASKIGAKSHTQNGAEITDQDAVALIEAGKIDVVINTPRGRGASADGAYIRRAASQADLPLFTTVAAAAAAAQGIAERDDNHLHVMPLQQYHSELA